jgi:hypothetical protein
MSHNASIASSKSEKLNEIIALAGMKANIINEQNDGLACVRSDAIYKYDFETNNQQHNGKRKYSPRIIIRGVMCLAFTISPLILIIYIIVAQYV